MDQPLSIQNDLTEEVSDINNTHPTLSVCSMSSVWDPGDEMQTAIAKILRREKDCVFRLWDVRRAAHTIKFSALQVEGFQHLVKETNKWLRDIKPPPNNRKSALRPPDNTIYDPPTRPHVATSAKSILRSPHKEFMKLKRSTQDYSKWREYVIAYAAWYTAQRQWEAIEEQRYRFCDSYMMKLDPRSASASQWKKWLKPNMQVKVLIRDLHMVQAKNSSRCYVQCPVYAEDLEAVLDLTVANAK